LADGRNTKVIKLHILKPADGMDWDELGTLLRDVRYRVFRLANLFISESYLNYHQARKNPGSEMVYPKIGELNRYLRQMLIDEAKKNSREGANPDRYSKIGALPAAVVDALSQYKMRAVLAKSKWGDVLKGNSSLPTFRRNMSIPIRCDKPGQRKLIRAADGGVELELLICVKPYPKIIIATKGNSLGDGQRAILDRLVDKKDDYRQRCFEIKEDERTRKWYLFVTYDFPHQPVPKLSSERVVGVDVGFSCPIYVAINNGYARLGRRHFTALGARIRSLQRQVIRKRRDMQSGGREDISGSTARSGHGRNRKLQPISILEGKIDNAYKTLNHQLSAAVIKFAIDNGAGIIQIEDLTGLKDKLSGSFIGRNWRYEELQHFIEYKAKEAGIELRKVNAKYTSRRCSKCGFINVGFSRSFRDAHGKPGKSTRFVCPSCGFVDDADYNAARNLATPDIDKIIAETEKSQLGK
jgi:IS605 OrfB family transposase